MIGGARSIGFGPSRVRSLPDGIARALAHYNVAQNGTSSPEEVAVDAIDSKPKEERGARLLPATTNGDFCLRCRQASLIVSEGCLRCTECGFKEC